MAVREGDHVHPTCPSWPSSGSAELMSDHCHVIAWAFLVGKLCGKGAVSYPGGVGLGNPKAVLYMPRVYSSSVGSVRPTSHRGRDEGIGSLIDV